MLGQERGRGSLPTLARGGLLLCFFGPVFVRRLSIGRTL